MTLIVVSGAPGTGKSTIAAALAADLRWPLLSLDPVKETLADVLGLGDEHWSDRLGDTAAELIFRLTAQFPDSIAEGWWRGARRGRSWKTTPHGRAGSARWRVACNCVPSSCY